MDRPELLPVWARELTARTRQRLVYALEHLELPDLRVETVRERGEQWWRRIEGLGRKTANEIGDAIGGWERPAPLAHVSDADLVMEMLRRGYVVSRPNGHDGT